MRIGTVRHKGLRRLIEADTAVGLPAGAASKLRLMLAFLQDMGAEEELRRLPVWKPHQLTGDREGTWAFFVTKDWRLTFRIDGDALEILDLDYEDYH